MARLASQGVEQTSSVQKDDLARDAVAEWECETI